MARITRMIPDDLRTGDRIDADVRGLFPIGTRLFSCGGIGHMFDYSRATHTAMVVVWQGRPFVLEQTREGPVFHSFAEAYLDRWDARIIQFVRHPVYDNAAMRAELEALAAVVLHEDRDYDLPGVFGFVNHRIKDDPKRDYCSELFYQLTGWHVSAFGTPYPARYSIRVSPYGLQRWAGGWRVFYKYK